MFEDLWAIKIRRGSHFGTVPATEFGAMGLSGGWNSVFGLPRGGLKSKLERRVVIDAGDSKQRVAIELHGLVHKVIGRLFPVGTSLWANFREHVCEGLNIDVDAIMQIADCCEVTTACQHTSPLRHLRSSSRCVADFHRNVGVSGTDISLSTSGKAAPKQTNQKTKTPRSHTESTTHVMRDPKPDSFGANSSSSQAHLLQTLLAPTCYLVVPLPLC